MTSAKVIADSISPEGYRVTTMEVTMHRFVLAEFNTHRMFSRNSASSRAIPFKKQLERVTTNPAIPVVWAAEQKGMQGGDEIEHPDRAERAWLDARDSAVRWAELLATTGVHKSIVNRLLEPFMWHTVIVTATEWDNFFRQRCSPLAQPEIRVAAELMREAYETSSPGEVHYGGWHSPYLEHDDIVAIEDYVFGALQAEETNPEVEKLVTETMNKVSVARCARVSYLTHDGKRDPIEDLTLYDRLVSADPPHASPLEHVCTPSQKAFTLGNLIGWEQLRHQVLGF